MNYAYTSSRVRALENNLPTPELLNQLAESKDQKECIGILNSSGFEGSSVDEIAGNMKEHKNKLINEIMEDRKEIEIIFYQKTFHNLKAAVKMIYSNGGVNMFYDDAEISGEEIVNALKNGNFASLPDYMASAAEEAYNSLMRTGDGRLSDMIIDKACLEAMADFSHKTRYDILKMYADETIAAADIKLLLRAGENYDLLRFAVSCKYFSADALLRAAEEGTAEELLESSGFGRVDLSNADVFCENRISEVLSREKYNIFTPAPAINFILEYDRLVGTVRYILICKANGIDKTIISERVKNYV